MIDVQGQRKKVFISYAHESEEYGDKVSAFADYLRRKGIDARTDRHVLGKSTSANIWTLFAQNLEEADKVIVILSKKYKEKFRKQKSGVKFEGELIVTDRQSNPDKYIFAVFSDAITEEVIHEVVPFCFSGAEMYCINNKIDSVDTIIRKIYNRPEYDFSNVAPAPYIPQSKSLPSFAGTARTRQKRSKSFEFNTEYYHTIYTVGKDRRTVSYEVFRRIRVTSIRLTEMEIRPQFEYKTTVHLSSSLVNLPETIEMNKDRRASFYYPIPNDNKEGDVIPIHFKMEMVYPHEESLHQYTLHSENDSTNEIHEIVLLYQDSASAAKLVRRKTDDFVGELIESIPFDEEAHAYRFSLVNPELDCQYILTWGAV